MTTPADLFPETAEDPAAPYGYKEDGTPKKGPGGRPPGGSSSKRSRARSAGTARAPRKTSPNSKPKNSGPDYRPTVKAFLGILTMPLRMSGPVGELDAAVVLDHADPIAELVHESAQNSGRLAAWLDKATDWGPWAAFVPLGLSIGAQIAANHRWMDDQITGLYGAVPREEYAAEKLRQAAEQAGEQPPPPAAEWAEVIPEQAVPMAPQFA